MDGPTPTPALGDVQIASVGALLADPARCRILMALQDGRALSASVLADEAGVSRSTTSGHLGRLTEHGLLLVESHGRHRYYRLAGDQVAELLERIMELAPARPVRSLREGTRSAQLRAARTCYDHLAGRLGVTLMAALPRAGHLEGGDGRFVAERAVADGVRGYGTDTDYALSRSGWAFLAEAGVHVPAGQRPLVRYCVDWSEQRHHLAGRVGRGLLERFLDASWIRGREVGRGVLVTPSGRAALADLFGVDWR